MELVAFSMQPCNLCRTISCMAPPLTSNSFRSAVVSPTFLSDLSQRSVRLSTFSDADSSSILSWITSDRELLWLAPGTPPPVTPRKIIDWGRERHQRLLFWEETASSPIGYAELNEMPSRADQRWIGHFILNPACRGRGLGFRFAEALLARAFVELSATDVLLVVFPDNAAAIKCYERAGLVALGKERKHFETTGFDHVFLRMGIHVARYRRLVQTGSLNGTPVPFGPSLEASAQSSRIV